VNFVVRDYSDAPNPRKVAAEDVAGIDVRAGRVARYRDGCELTLDAGEDAPDTCPGEGCDAALEGVVLPDGGDVTVRSRTAIVEETERLAGVRYSIETQARIETLLWVLGLVDSDRCPSGTADDQPIQELTNRGPWPFDPDLESDVRTDGGLTSWTERQNTRPGGEGLPQSDHEGEAVWLFTCVECGRRWADPAAPIAGCGCGGDAVGHQFDHDEYRRIRWFSDPRTPEVIDGAS
jgi:hypothetical protein